jgi:tetratricopeptide (TPR) repeat protein
LLREATIQQIEMKNLKQAIAIYTQALRVDPSSAPALMGLAECWNLHGEPEIALDYTKKALFIMQSNKMPPDSADMKWIREYLRYLEDY